MTRARCGAAGARRAGGAPATEFTATSSVGGAIVFENAAHDFPMRLGYQRVDATHLTAWIDGGAGAAGRRIEYPMARVACELEKSGPGQHGV